MDSKRKGVIKEIVHTERNYVNNLYYIIKFFHDPLIEISSSNNSFIQLEDINVIFSDIKVIFEVNHRFLKELELGIDNSEFKLGSCFVKFGLFFKWYQNYVCNYDRAYQTLNRLKQRSSQFSTFITQTESNQELKNLDLPSLLVQPIQRVPQYKLLLTKLAKFTPHGHIDYSGTIKAVKLIQEIAHYINEKKRDFDNINKLVNISRQIIGYPSILVPHRRFCLEDNFEVLNNSISGISEVHLLGFNDILLISRKQNDFYEVLYHAYYDNVSIKFNKSTDILSLEINGNVFTLSLSSEIKRNHWIHHINYSKEVIAKKKANVRQHNNSLEQLKILERGISRSVPLGILGQNPTKAKSHNIIKRESIGTKDDSNDEINERTEKDVHAYILKEGFESIDSFFKIIGMVPQYIATIEILQDKNSTISRPSLFLVNYSYISIVEKGRIIYKHHLLDIESIISNKHPDITFKIKNENSIIGRSIYCDDIIHHTRRCFMTSFPFFPKKYQLFVDVDSWRLHNIHIPSSKLNYDGFPRTYYSVCDWLNVRPRSDIVFEAKHFKRNNEGAEFNFSNLQDLTIDDYKVIYFSLRYNRYYKALVFKSNELTKDNVILLADFLKYNTSITKFYFSNNNLTKELMNILQDSMSSRKMHSIVIKNNPIEDKGLQFLTKYVENKKGHSLSSINISNTSIGDKLLSQLFLSFRHETTTYYNLTKINISENKINEEGSVSLASYLAIPCSVKELNISNTQAKLSPIIGAIMRGCIYLSKLIISKNKMTKKASDALVKLMQSSNSLNYLDISSTGIKGEELNFLITTISHNPYIKDFNLVADNNELGLIGAISIAPSMRNLRGIVSISLKENELTDDGISILSKSLKCSSNGVQKIYLDGNFKCKSAKERRSMINNLSNILSSNFSSLRYISIAGGTKNHSQLKQDIIPLLNAASKGKLLEINISSHKMGNAGAFALSRLIKSTKTLQRIIWDDNLVGYEGIASVINAIRDNNSLISFDIPVSDISLILSQNDIKIKQKLNKLLNDLQLRLAHNFQKIQNANKNEKNIRYDIHSSDINSESSNESYTSISKGENRSKRKDFNTKRNINELNNFSDDNFIKERPFLGRRKIFVKVQSKSATESLDLAGISLNYDQKRDAK